jgi:hypothetical protein
MISTVGPDIPQDLLVATGRYAGPLGWDIDRDFPRAELWMESKFPLWAKSILEDWAASRFDHLETVIFSRSDDSAQRLYYYLCELQRRGLVRGPAAVLFDVARIARSTSGAKTVASVRELAERLELDDSALEHGLYTCNQSRNRAAKALEGRTCLLAGTAPPDRRVHAMIEAAGWRAAGDTLGEVWRRLGPPVEEGTKDPAAAIGIQLHEDHTGPRGFFDRGAALLDEVRASGATRVVLWYAEEDEAEVWHLPERRKALETAGIPALVLTRCDWRAKDGVAARIAEFLA